MNFFEATKVFQHLIDVHSIADDWVISMNVVLAVVGVRDFHRWVVWGFLYDLVSPLQAA